jgi:cob(I)alamin adenosyltransferase
MVKIYTKTGDQGETGLWGGKRVSKASLRIEAYGTADELNSLLGVAKTKINSSTLNPWLEKIQNQLHVICADLANPDLTKEGPRIQASHTEELERACDDLDKKLPELKKFILPGGSEAGALLHFARTVTRRAERRVIELSRSESINLEVVRYLNRLSDLLFLMARTANHEAGIEEDHPRY